MGAVNLLGGLANDDTVILLRRIAKMAESLGNKDGSGRQRVTIDFISTGLALGTITTVTTVGDQTAIQGWDRRLQFIPMRTAYNTGIRSQLIFS